MSKDCFICQKKIGFFEPCLKTSDHKYICIDDVKNMYDLDNDKIPNGIKVRISSSDSKSLLKEYANSLKQRQQAQQERDEQIRAWQAMNLSQIARKVEGINLKPREYGYYAYNDNIEWYEERQRTNKVRFAGPVANIHIAKGLNYRLGSINTDIQHEQYLKLIFNGALLLTNKRIILGNSEGVKAYPLSRLLRAIPYSDGVVLCSESGKKVILTGFDDATEFNILLDRILTEDDILPK